MNGKGTMASADNLQKRISELSDKDLVLMVTLDRKEYLEDALKVADSELKKRNISKTTIDNYLQLLDIPGRQSEKKGTSYVRIGEPGSDEEAELWEEVNLPKDAPKDIDPFIHPLTNRAPEPFFTIEAESKLREKRCVLCTKMLYDNPHYCLVGRHRKKRVDGVIKKVKYRYQACYVPICKSCYSKYNKVLKGLTILLWLGIVFAFSAVMEGEIKKEISLYMGMAGFLGVLIGLLGKRYVRGPLLNKKVIVETNLYPHLGVPCKRNQLLKSAKSELKPLAKSIDKMF